MLAPVINPDCAERVVAVAEIGLDVFAGEEDAQGIRVLLVPGPEAGIDHHVRRFRIQLHVEMPAEIAKELLLVAFFKIVPEINKGYFEFGFLFHDAF